ncbi:MAG: Uncharacterized protein LiPW15_660 [Parcubacteria group bacterium LiPW_15]|nr:MAG: Uncharacterized protein LiPW15_660 [Parcubacteria group bacterium LiPW_15]
MARSDVKIYLSDAGRARKRKRTLSALLVVLLAAYSALLVFCLLSFRTGFFRAKDIEITGNREVFSAEIMTALEAQVFAGSYVKYALGFKNILIWPDTIQNPGKFLPQVKSMDVVKRYWSKKIEIRVVERKPYGIWCMGTEAPECFWFDGDGYIFKRGLSTEGNIIKSVSDLSGRKLGLGNRVLGEDFFPNLKSAFDVLEASGIGTRSVELKDLALQEVAAKTAEGPLIYFSLRFSAANFLDLLETLKGTKAFSKLQYIDLRIQNRAYYK